MMPRAYARRIRRGARIPDMPAAVWARLRDEPYPPSTNPFTEIDLDYTGIEYRAPKVWGDKTLRMVWADNQAEVLDEWVAAHPGTRPSLWWAYSSKEPRDPTETELNQLSRLGALRAGELRKANRR